MSPAGLLQPIPIPHAVWEDISLDFITGLPRSHRFEVILVVVDRLSKYAHFLPLKHPFSARTVAEVFVREVAKLHGFPKSIISDRDPLFLSRFWKELFRLQGTVLRMSTSYHPQTDRQTEVVNRCLETFLRCFSSEQPAKWYMWLSWAEFWYNTSTHTATGSTPFEIVYGRPPPSIIQYLPGETQVDSVAAVLSDRDEALRQLKFHLHRAQQTMKKNADKHRRQLEFSVGDWVYVKLRPHRQLSVARRINPKLSPRYYGPFQILSKVGAVAYKLQLPNTAQIHPVFHVSQLKCSVTKGSSLSAMAPGLISAEEDFPTPETVLAVREGKDSSCSAEWIILWKSQPVEEATWESAAEIRAKFPDFNLEDKANFVGHGIDRNHSSKWSKPIQVYSRRPKNKTQY